MRLSSTPPNNICKVNVNQPSSLQQRQGMKVPPEVEYALDDIFLALICGLDRTFYKLGQTRGDSVTESDYLRQQGNLSWVLSKMRSHYFKALKGHTASDHLTLAFEKEKGGTHILSVMNGSKSVWFSGSKDDSRFETFTAPLEHLLKDLPSLVKTYPKPRFWEKSLFGLRSSSTT